MGKTWSSYKISCILTNCYFKMTNFELKLNFHEISKANVVKNHERVITLYIYIKCLILRGPNLKKIYA